MEGGKTEKAQNISSLLMLSPFSKVKRDKNIFITVDIIFYCDINAGYILVYIMF